MSSRKRSRSRDRSHHHSTSSSSTDYKELYKELKRELKERDRDVEELEEEVAHYSRDAKKAKADSQDLWKIYHNMQTELQQAYERNAKLQAEKVGIEAILDGERRERDKEKASKGDQNVDKLQSALMAMQKEKLEFQGKYNAIVMENKSLREKETTYGPRIREIDLLKKQLADVKQNQEEVAKESRLLQTEFSRHGVNNEKVEKYRRWNSLLMMECEEKSNRLRNRPQAERNLRILIEENKALRDQLKIREQKVDAITQRCRSVRQRGVEARRKLLLLRMHFKWNRDAIASDLRKEKKAIERNFSQLRTHIHTKTGQEVSQIAISNQVSNPEHTSLPPDDDGGMSTFSRIKEELNGLAETPQELRQSVVELRRELEQWEESLDTVNVPKCDKQANDLLEVHLNLENGNTEEPVEDSTGEKIITSDDKDRPDCST